MNVETVNTTGDDQGKYFVKELSQLIDMFIKESEKKDSTQKDIVYSVYEFLGAAGYKEFLTIYSFTSAFALSAFSMNQEARDGLLAVMGEEYFDYFCQMLLSIINLCNKINTSEMNMAGLDKARWRCCRTDILTIECIKEIKKEMLMYECRLKCLKDNL